MPIIKTIKLDSYLPAGNVFFKNEELCYYITSLDNPYIGKEIVPENDLNYVLIEITSKQDENRDRKCFKLVFVQESDYLNEANYTVEHPKIVP